MEGFTESPSKRSGEEGNSVGSQIKESAKRILACMYPADGNCYSCVCCCASIYRGEPMVECPDCAAIFCKGCVESGDFESHNCEDYDFDEE